MPNLAERKAAAEWIKRLDGLAEQANKNLNTAMHLNEHGPDDAMPGAALLAIASQLAYGNAVAAATFYMQNTLWVSLESERGDA